MWQTCISADEQPLKRGEIERQRVRKRVRLARFLLPTLLTVTAKTWSNLKHKKIKIKCSISAWLPFTSNFTADKLTWQRHRKCVSGNLSAWKIKNISMCSCVGKGVFSRVSQTAQRVFFFLRSTLLSCSSIQKGSEPQKHKCTFSAAARRCQCAEIKSEEQQKACPCVNISKRKTATIGDQETSLVFWWAFKNP